MADTASACVAHSHPVRIRNLFERAVGRRPSGKWVAWGAGLMVVVWAGIDCRHDLGAACVFEQMAWSTAGLLFAAGTFLLLNGGPAMLRTWLSVRKVRAALDPVAHSLGASCSIRWSEARCNVFYSFSEYYVVVPVGPGGARNPASFQSGGVPAAPPPAELAVLLAAAHRHCKTPGHGV